MFLPAEGLSSPPVFLLASAAVSAAHAASAAAQAATTITDAFSVDSSNVASTDPINLVLSEAQPPRFEETHGCWIGPQAGDLLRAVDCVEGTDFKSGESFADAEICVSMPPGSPCESHLSKGALMRNIRL